MLNYLMALCLFIPTLSFTMQNQLSNDDLMQIDEMLRKKEIGGFKVREHGIDGYREDGQTPLLAAAIRGDKELVVYLHQKGANIHKEHKTDLSTALHYAAYVGAQEVVEYLMDNGARLDSYDDDGWHPLSCAASAGHEKTVKYFLDKNLEVLINPKRLAVLIIAQKGKKRAGKEKEAAYDAIISMLTKYVENMQKSGSIYAIK